MPNECGGCTMCCKLPGIDDFKPVNRWCKFCTPGKGCGTYHDRPQACLTYECAFLTCDMPQELRPDRFGAIFEGVRDEPNVIVMRTPPEKYGSILQRADVILLLSMFALQGTKVIITDAVRAKLFEKDDRRFSAWVVLNGTAEPGAADPVTGLRRYQFSGVIDCGELRDVPGFKKFALAKLAAA